MNDESAINPSESNESMKDNDKSKKNNNESTLILSESNESVKNDNKSTKYSNESIKNDDEFMTNPSESNEIELMEPYIIDNANKAVRNKHTPISKEEINQCNKNQETNKYKRRQEIKKSTRIRKSKPYTKTAEDEYKKKTTCAIPRNISTQNTNQPHEMNIPKIFTVQNSHDNLVKARVELLESLLRLEHLNTEEKDNVYGLIRANADIFHLPSDNLGCTNVIKHKITTTDEQPINTKQYRYPPIHKEEIQKQVGELLDSDIIQPSGSSYNSPLWIVPKKPDSKGNKRWRMVIDYRSLNEKTLGDAYPLPNITDILDQLGGAKYFSVFDLASGFHQIQMDEKDKGKTAFTTPYGHYEFNRMPFGLKNAPATFQRLMDQVLTGLQGIEMFVYLDDIVLYAESLEEHDEKFGKLAERLRHANLKLQPDKCEFLKKEVGYLGHIIGEDGVRPDPKKLEAVELFPRPKTQKNIKQFLGLAGYYRRFIKDFSKIAKPMSNLLKKDSIFLWSTEQQQAFEKLKGLLCEQPILQYPDFTRPFVVTTDASYFAIGGILSQGDIGKDLPISYVSRVLNGAESNYSTIEKELLAIVYSVQYFRPYLYGRKFTLVTDHKPLLWLHSVKDPTSRLLRWKIKLAEHEYTVVYKTGKTNLNADALSRNPVASQLLAINKYSLEPDELSEDEPDTVTTQTDIHSDPPLAHNYEELKTTYGGSFSKPRAESGNEDEYEQLEMLEDWLNADDHPHITKLEDTIEDIANEETNDEGKSSKLTNTGNKTNGGNDFHKLETLGNRLKPYDDAGKIEILPLDENLTKQKSEKQIVKSNPVIIEDIQSRSNVITIRDNIVTKKGAIIWFANEHGEPIDSGGKSLAACGKAIKLGNINAKGGETWFKKRKSRKQFVIILSEEGDVSEQLKSAIRELKTLITQFKITPLFMSETKVGIYTIPWKHIVNVFRMTFITDPVKILVCTNKIILPHHSERLTIIEEAHASAIGGHKGVTKTYNRIKQYYYWENLKEEIQKFIMQCISCQKKKLVRVKTKQPMVITDTSSTAFDKISLDIVGPLPTTKNEYSFLLTMQDNLTKYSLAVPLKRATAQEIGEAFVKKFICQFGAPRAVLTDQGQAFIGTLLKSIAKYFKIQQFKTTAFHPQSNGSLERSHHVLIEYLKHFIKDKQDWDNWIELAMFSYNTSTHEATKYSPYELVYGRIARAPSSRVPADGDLKLYSEYISDLLDTFHDIQTDARENIEKAKFRYKEYYDRKLNPQEVKVGQRVFLMKDKEGKFGDHYTGPYEVLEILSKENIKIQMENGKTKVIHLNRMKIARTPEEPRVGLQEKTVDRHVRFGPQISEFPGDILSSPKGTTLVATISSDLDMTTGQCKKIKEKFGRLPSYNKPIKLGEIITLVTNKNRIIFFLITKEKADSRPSYETLKNALIKLNETCKNFDLTTLSMPPLDCEPGNLEWDKVHEMLKQNFTEEFDISIYHDSPTTATNLLITLDDYNIAPTIRVLISGSIVHALIDTGAQCSFIDHAAVNYLESIAPRPLRRLSDAPPVMMGTAQTGVFQQSIERVIINMHVAGARLQHDVVVMKDLSQPFVLGLNFLDKVDAKIDLENDLLILGKPPITIPFADQRRKEQRQERDNRMEIQEITGNLFDAPLDTPLAHCVAKDLEMNAGIALQFRIRFNSIRQLKEQNPEVGDALSLQWGQRLMFYLITKRKSNDKPTYDDLKDALKTLYHKCSMLRINEIAMPRIGCGLDQLDWNTVKQLIKRVFPNDFKIKIYNIKKMKHATTQLPELPEFIEES